MKKNDDEKKETVGIYLHSEFTDAYFKEENISPGFSQITYDRVRGLLDGLSYMGAIKGFRIFRNIMNGNIEHLYATQIKDISNQYKWIPENHIKVNVIEVNFSSQGELMFDSLLKSYQTWNLSTFNKINEEKLINPN